MALPDFSSDFFLATDASTLAVGSVLMQRDDKNKYKVIAYYSRKLNNAEQKYGISDLEALAVMDSLAHFRYIIYGYPIHVLTDHKALKDYFKNPGHSGRRARWFLKLLDYNVDFEYLPGRLNTVADCLSRYAYSCLVTVDPFQLTDDIIKAGQRQDKEIQNIIEVLKSSNHNIPDSLHKYKLNELYINDEILVKKTQDHDQIVIPPSLVHKIIHLHHDTRAHPGRDKTMRQIKLRYFFKKMSNHVKTYIDNCHTCNTVRGQTQTHPLHTYPIPDQPFDKIVIDLLKLQTSTSGFNYILVLTDYFTRYSELIPQRTKTGKETANNILTFINRYGAPEMILSDNGLEFNNALLTELTQFYGSQKVLILPYRPQSNGVAERINRKILDVLKTITPADNENWDENIPAIQYIINTRIHESINMSPHQALFNYVPRLPYELNTNKFRSKIQNNPMEGRINNAIHLHKQITKAMKESNEKMVKRHNKDIDGFNIGDLVFEKKNVLGKTYKSEPAFTGPYEIIEKRTGNKFILKAQNGDIKVSHADRFKRFKGTLDNTNPQEESEVRRSPRLKDKNPVYNLE